MSSSLLRRQVKSLPLLLAVSVCLNVLLLMRGPSSSPAPAGVDRGVRDCDPAQPVVQQPWMGKAPGAQFGVVRPGESGPAVPLVVEADDDAEGQHKPAHDRGAAQGGRQSPQAPHQEQRRGDAIELRPRQQGLDGTPEPVLDNQGPGRGAEPVDGDRRDGGKLGREAEAEDAEPEDEGDGEGDGEGDEDGRGGGGGAAGGVMRMSNEDVEADLEEEQLLADLPYRGLLREREPRVFVAVISGGSKPATKANRDAVIETWFDENTYIATHEQVNTKRVLWLSDEAESGGFRMLPRKVKHMWAHMYENYLEDYDWFVKADDDTYINMDRLKKTLSVFNASMPVYLGKPFATKTRGAKGPGPLWRDFTTMYFCHGGSGYVMSRELLRLVGPVIRDAEVSTSLEDAAVASVLYETTGVRCINLNAKMFGGLDLMGNSHDQREIMAGVSNYERRSPEILWKTATIHSVVADTTYKLHSLYDRLAQKNLDDKVDELAEHDLEVRRWTMASSWNCTINAPLPDQTPYQALCMQSALLSPPPFTPKHFAELEQHWKLTPLNRPCAVRLSSENKPPGTEVFAWMSYDPDSVSSAPFPPRATPGDGSSSFGSSSQPRDVILVQLDGSDQESVDALQLLLRSLRATGSVAEVVVFVAATDDISQVVNEVCGVSVVKYDATAVRSALAMVSGITVNDDILAFGLYENFLFAHGQRYRDVLQVHVDTYFQRDPFASVTTNGGVVLYVDNPVVPMEQVPCFAGTLRLNEMVARLSLSVALGPSNKMREYFSRAVAVPYRSRRCRFADAVMLQAFRKDFSVYFRVTVVTPWDGPMALLTEREEPAYVNGTGANSGRIVFVNGKGTPATAVFNYLRLMNSSPTLLHMKPPGQRRSVLDLVLAELPKRLHGSVRRAADVLQLGPEKWPQDSKAYLRWTALEGLSRSRADALAFKPVWELLARYKYFSTNKTKAVRIAHVATHKTGAELLSGVLFRFAARQGLRVFHRGEWPFLEAEVLEAPQESWQNKYDIIFSHLSPKGQWHGDFSTASRFYNAMLGPNHRRLLFLQDPHQHYISWLYYYIIPKKTRFRPVDVVQDFVKQRINRNLLCQEFNLRTIDVLNDFIQNELPRFDVILLKERLDESLVLLRRRMNWDLLDITYMLSPQVSRRFDGRPLPPTPKSREITAEITTGIDSLIRMDKIFYAAASKRLDELIAAEDPSFKIEVEALQKVTSALSDSCKQYSGHPFCKWYWLSEMEILHMLTPDGYTQAWPMI